MFSSVFYFCELKLIKTYYMATFLAVLLEIIKTTTPALIVFLTVYYLMKTFFTNQRAMKQMELNNSAKKTTVPMRLQAYERLSLLCERISVPNLVLRLRKEDMTINDLRMSMLISIQKEIEYNVTQQVYVGENLWQIVKLSRNQVTTIINEVAAKMPEGSTGADYARALLVVSGQTESALDRAQSAIKTEAALLL